MSITTSDGVALNYTDDGEGMPVVLVAGFTAPLESWEPQRRALLAAGFRVLGLDRRSHGRSESPAYGHRMTRHGKDVHDFLVATGLDDCGHAANLDRADLLSAAIVDFLR
jgi:pimeloyl-ACP methyl ester carboxylesterase